MEIVPLVSIITLNYNQAEVTCQFLESCRSLTYDNYAIHVCDMDSKQDLRVYVGRKSFDHTEFHYSDRNLGFAGGNNWGMQFAKGDYILMLNNDTEVEPDLIQKLLIPFEQDSRTGIVCPVINYYDNKSVIQYAGFAPMNFYTGRTRTIGNKEIDHRQFDGIHETFGAHGAAMMVSRAVIDETGKFPEKFFLYYEEWDWSTRILNAGYKIYLQGNARVYHKESMSVGKSNPLKEYYLTRNRILYMRRNSERMKLVIFYLFYSCFTIPKTAIKYAYKRNGAFLKAFFLGVSDSIRLSKNSQV